MQWAEDMFECEPEPTGGWRVRLREGNWEHFPDEATARAYLQRCAAPIAEAGAKVALAQRVILRVMCKEMIKHGLKRVSAEDLARGLAEAADAANSVFNDCFDPNPVVLPSHGNRH